MKLWCCACQTNVEARLTDGSECYPHRPDLAEHPRWKCDTCGNHVGCHHKTKNPIRPFGNIPSPELKRARQHIHALIDPVWKSGKIKRAKVYAHISKTLGYQYHTGELKTIDEARRVWVIARDFINSIETGADNDNK